jgi:diguanylate cyclase (GGDEF)-like protein
MTDDRFRDALESAARAASAIAASDDLDGAMAAIREAAPALGWREVALTPDGELAAGARAPGLGDEEARAGLELLAALAALALRVTAPRDESATTIDPATDLLNRRGVEETLRREVTRAYRVSQPLAAIVLEIDRFDENVEPLGAETATAVARAVAGVLRTELRQLDAVGRVGAAQFRALLPGSNSAGAREVAERLRCVIAASRVPGAGAITATLGVAALPEHAANGAGLLQAAETAVATGQRRGRNCVVVAHPIRQ